MRRMIWLPAALMLLVWAAPVWADTSPVAGCGNDFTLDTVPDIFDNVVDLRIYPTEADRTAVLELLLSDDSNGDGYLCWKQYKPNRGQDKAWGAEDYVVTLSLDNNAAGRLP